MNKSKISRNKIISLILLIAIPLSCYFILKLKTDQALIVPRHFIYDSIIIRDNNGKKKYDTVWHSLPNLTFINQWGDTVNLHSKKGKIWIIDFFFTRCGGICPKLTNNMKLIQESFKKGGGGSRIKIDTSVIQLASFSIDPEHDSPSILKNYAQRFKVGLDNWWFLTGSKKTIYDFAFEDLKVDKYDIEAQISPNFIHTSRFILIDKNMNIRGFYNGLETESLKKLSTDIGLLFLEKNKSSNGILLYFKKIIWLVLLGLIVLFIFIKKINK